MESGLLPKEEAKKVFERKQKKAQQQKLSSPMKTVVTVKKKDGTVTIEKQSTKSPVSSDRKSKMPDTKTASKQQPKKRKSRDDSSEDDSDADFTLSERKLKKQRA